MGDHRAILKQPGAILQIPARKGKALRRVGICGAVDRLPLPGLPGGHQRIIRYEAIPTGTNAGDYTVYYRVTGDGNHTDAAARSVKVTIQKAAPSVTAPTGKTLTYTSKAQALVSAGKATGGTMEYSLDNRTWSDKVPTGTDAGDYTVYYRVTGDANHADVAAKRVTATIAKAASSVTAAPTAKTLTYSGKAQALVSAGKATGGTMEYSLDNRTWSDKAPTGTNAGDYTVYYRVTGDGNHTTAS